MMAKLSFSALSNLGNRPVNEDSIAIFNKNEDCCFLLCDGLGGHGMGDVASQLACEVFEQSYNEIAETANYLPQAFWLAQNALLEKQKELHRPLQMKTTAVAMVTEGQKAYIGHCGDSRLYVFSNGLLGPKILKRTLDHSVPQMLANVHDIKESDIRHHPDRSYLLKVLGIKWEEAMYELQPVLTLRPSMSFLLCSDGFWELIEEKDMCALLKTASTVEEWLTAMNDLVQKNGEGVKMDNNSAIAVWYR